MIKQVILIEDDDAMRLSLTQTLDLEEITVIAANSLMQAKRNIRANFPGVIISDIRMPTNDGFDVLAYVKSVDNELPTIMLVPATQLLIRQRRQERTVRANGKSER